MCNVCDRKLSTQYNLNTHQSRFHKGRALIPEDPDATDYDNVMTKQKVQSRQRINSGSATANKTLTNLGLAAAYDDSYETAAAAAAATAAAPTAAAAAATSVAPAAASAVSASQRLAIRTVDGNKGDSPHLPDKALQLSESPVIFKHPFTMIISGPTQSGKTHLVKTLLERKPISPSPGRILYLYKRWQPLYTEMRMSIPHLEFIEGIPTNLDDDKFLDCSVNNIIILDDLMSSVASDKTIAELFTEGSHHRNLSVIYLTQNIFPSGKGAVTQRRNTQYMILFKSPMGQDQIRTLGRFMFPGKLKEFIKQYQEATRHPRGHLLIDAKQMTKESERLKYNIFNDILQDDKAINQPIVHVRPPSSLCEEFETSGIVREKIDTGGFAREKISTSKNEQIATKHYAPLNVTHSVSDNQRSQTTEMDTIACIDCGTMFDNIHDLQRHVKSWCPDKEPYEKRIKLESESVSTTAEHPVFQQFLNAAIKQNAGEKKRKIKKYMEQGLDKVHANEKAAQKLHKSTIAIVLQSYIEFIQNVMQLGKGLIHSKVVESINELSGLGFNEKTAITLAVKQFENHIDSLLMTEKDPENSEEGENREESGSSEADASEDSDDSSPDTESDSDESSSKSSSNSGDESNTESRNDSDQSSNSDASSEN